MSHLQLKDIEGAKEELSTISSLPDLDRLHDACGQDKFVSSFNSDQKQESRRNVLS